MNLTILSLIAIFSLSCYFFGKSKVLKQTKISGKKFHSLPEYYGYYLAAWCGLPALIILFFWSFSELYIVKVFILSDFRADPSIDENKLNLIFSEIKSHQNSILIDAKQIAKDLGNTKATNMVLLGAAASHLPLSDESLQQAIQTLFERKGERIVAKNLEAFIKGKEIATETVS